MIKSLEFTGRTEELAIDAALSKLGMDRDDVSVEVLERPKSGFLGIGSSPAKVRVSFEAPDEKPAPVAPRAPAATGSAPRKESTHAARITTPAAPRKESTHTARITTPAAPDDATAAQIVAFLTGLMSHMDVAATPVVSVSEEGSYEVVLEGTDLGCLIGRRGETLDAIQQLTGYSVNRGAEKRARVHVDAEHYRARREETLEALAMKVAEKVTKFRKDVTLEPMNAYERHVVHAALQEVPNISTYSTGVEPNRRTVVAYKPEA